MELWRWFKMKRYLKKIIIILIQIFMFYIFPLFAGPTDAMGMVFLILVTTFILSIIYGTFKSKYKYLYPILISFIFIPSTFIYYNESALIHSIWYLIDVYIGLIIGIIIKKLIK